MDNPLKTQAFKLKGRLYTFTVLQLLSLDKAVFEQELAEVIAKAPRLFENTPIVLDLAYLSAKEASLDGFELMGFCECLRRYGLIPIAVQGTSGDLNSLAQKQGLACLSVSSTPDRSLQIPDEAVKPLSEETLPSEVDSMVLEAGKSKLQTIPVRSGQQVVSKGGDLVVTASVSAGAELLAEGNIHVYGTLRGRALAGISGNLDARIFCQSLEAELISIAGFYRLSDGIDSPTGPCQIYLKDNHIQIEPFL